jgi:glycosyltransferase involved in cell wall biosynthesis
MESHVRLLGFIPDDRLAAHYQSADLFVLPTQALEGFGLVTTEALACGVPVVGTPVGATPEILGGLDARLVAPGTTPDDLAHAILGYLDGEWSADLTPERLHQFVAGRYTWEKHVAETETAYHSVLRACRETNGGGTHV